MTSGGRRWDREDIRAVGPRSVPLDAPPPPGLASILGGTSSGRIVKESDARVVQARLVSDDLGGHAFADEPSLDQSCGLAWFEPFEAAERLDLEVWTGRVHLVVHSTV